MISNCLDHLSMLINFVPLDNSVELANCESMTVKSVKNVPKYGIVPKDSS